MTSFLTNSGPARAHARPFPGSAAWHRTQGVFPVAGIRHSDWFTKNGFAYSGYGAPEDKPRPWELDAVPLLIPAAEWATVSAGLQQTRAFCSTWCCRTFTDLKRCCTNGILPAELVLAHPGFLRPYHGQQPPLNTFSSFLRRRPGSFFRRCLVGVGRSHRSTFRRRLCLGESRCCLTHVARGIPTLPSHASGAVLHDRTGNVCDVLAPNQRENPRVVLLSDGPTSPKLFRRCVPGAIPGIHAGRGWRSRRSQRPGDAQKHSAGCYKSM